MMACTAGRPAALIHQLKEAVLLQCRRQRPLLPAQRPRFIGRSRAARVHRGLTLVLLFILAIGTGLALLQGHWLTGLATAGVVVVALLPVTLSRRFSVYIPPEFESLAVVFVYASLFLGELRGYYLRFWWWDTLLHTFSGFLLGILGFLLAHVLNEKRQISLHMNPGFVALFAFMFALGTGALWEIFEFAMDQLFGLNMQKSGLVDTMVDLIVDAIGALCISILGYIYLRRSQRDSFLERWIVAFIEANPRLFRDG